VAAIVMGDRAYAAAGSWEVSTLWLIVSFALGLVGAILGGWVCALIARPSTTPPKVLAGVALALGLLMAAGTLVAPRPEAPEPRPARAGALEGFTSAQTPTIALFINPFIGAAGVLLGAALVKRSSAPPLTRP